MDAGQRPPVSYGLAVRVIVEIKHGRDNLALIRTLFSIGWFLPVAATCQAGIANAATPTFAKNYSAIARLSASTDTLWLNMYMETTIHTCGGVNTKFALKLNGTEGSRQVARMATAFYLSQTPVSFSYHCNGNTAEVSYIKTE